MNNEEAEKKYKRFNPVKVNKTLSQLCDNLLFCLFILTPSDIASNYTRDALIKSVFYNWKV